MKEGKKKNRKVENFKRIQESNFRSEKINCHREKDSGSERTKRNCTINTLKALSKFNVMITTKTENFQSWAFDEKWKLWQKLCWKLIFTSAHRRSLRKSCSPFSSNMNFSSRFIVSLDKVIVPCASTWSESAAASLKILSGRQKGYIGVDCTWVRA